MPLPETLGRLERVGLLGTGGFATVWHYRDRELDSDVAVKALADNWAQRDDVRERFLEEARILRRADSDHIVRVYDIGEHEQTPYFVMTFADRGSLADLLSRHDGVPVEHARVVALVEQAAAGLDVLHEQGVIHRDVKPQNLLLRSSPDGEDRLLVADLGVAKAMASASGLTQLVGTPAYMAPEQAAGMGLDARTDVYSLGVLTRALLTGRPDPSGDSLLPPGLDAAILDATASEPADRPSSAGEFALALRAGLEGPAIASPRHGTSATPETSARTTRRTPPVAVVAWSVLMLVVAFAASYVIASALR